MKNKNAVITGAVKSGYGLAITKLLIQNGYHVYGSYEEDLAKSAHNLKIELEGLTLVQVDHSSRLSLKNFIGKIPGQIDALINGQFFFEMEDLQSFDHDLWEKSIAVNLTAPNFLLHELKSKLQPGSAVLTITSTEGFIGSFGASAYAATKAAIHNLTKTWANNLGPLNIRCNSLAAGWIGGVMDTDEVFNMSRKITPLGRLGEAEEIAKVALFLISRESSFVNGTVITVDGGYSGVDIISQYEFYQSQKGTGDKL